MNETSDMIQTLMYILLIGGGIALFAYLRNVKNRDFPYTIAMVVLYIFVMTAVIGIGGFFLM